mgnify:CR=1 FL=1
MYDWSDEHRAIIDVMRRFVDEEIRPHLDDLEHNGMPPYDIIRKMYQVFGLKEMAKENFARALERKKNGEAPARTSSRGGDPAAQLITTIELCRVSLGLVTSMGVSTGLAAGTINKLGTPAQMERWGLDLVTMDKVGAWAITEPDSGSDALGGMRTTAKRDGDGYVLNGQKTWITNGPYADTIVLYAKLDEGDGTDIRDRKVLTFVLDKGMDGLVQSKPMRKMGQHGSPTGEVFLTDVFVGKDRLLGETEDTPGGGRQSAKDNFVQERVGMAAMALGVINVVGSSISRETDAGIYLRVGPEIGVASTKAFVGQVMVCAMLALYIGRRRYLSQDFVSGALRDLEAIPNHIERILQQSEHIRRATEKYIERENWLFLGRGVNYPVALEGALKLKEISYIHAEGMPSAEMKHGPIALIDKGMPCVFVATRNSQYDKVLSNIQEVRARGAHVVAIATEGNEDIQYHADDVIYIPKTPAFLQAVLAVFPLQLLAYHIAVNRGCDVDQPPNLAKSVTVE